jgi:serine/threonine protein kinase
MSKVSQCSRCGRTLPESTSHDELCATCQATSLEESPTLTQPDSGSPNTPQLPSRTLEYVPATTEELAAFFPQLEVLELIGHGGMGAVYRVRQRQLDRLSALKIIRTEVSADPTFVERFAREARALARLDHPGVVSVYDSGIAASPGEDDPASITFLLMEFVDGTDLRKLMKAGELSPEQALQLVPQICEAMQYAHDQGIVHRDIKPENILITTDSRPKIADFGLARIIDGDRVEDVRLTGTRQVMGTPRYMAPEQLTGTHSVDHRADIYSLGVVIYEMLTGELPVGRFAPPSESTVVDRRIDEVILRSLHTEPDERYQRAGELGSDVTRISDSQVSATASDVAVQNSRQGGGAAWRWVLLATATLAAITAVSSRDSISEWIASTDPTPSSESVSERVVDSGSTGTESTSGDPPVDNPDNAGTPKPDIPPAFLKRILVEYDKTPIQEVVKHCAATANVSVGLNLQALQDAGHDSSQPVSMALTEASVDTILRLIVSDLGDQLALRYEDDVAFISYADQRSHARRDEPFSDETPPSQNSLKLLQEHVIYQFDKTPFEQMLVFVQSKSGVSFHMQGSSVKQLAEDRNQLFLWTNPISHELALKMISECAGPGMRYSLLDGVIVIRSNRPTD